MPAGGLSVEDYDKQIADAEEALRQLRCLRKSALMRERMHRNHQDPAFMARREKAAAEYRADPGRRSLRSIQHRLAALASKRALPAMTPKQFNRYKTLTRKDGQRLSRAAALELVLASPHQTLSRD